MSNSSRDKRYQHRQQEELQCLQQAELRRQQEQQRRRQRQEEQRQHRQQEEEEHRLQEQQESEEEEENEPDEPEPEPEPELEPEPEEGLIVDPSSSLVTPPASRAPRPPPTPPRAPLPPRAPSPPRMSATTPKFVNSDLDVATLLKLFDQVDALEGGKDYKVWHESVVLVLESALLQDHLVYEAPDVNTKAFATSQYIRNAIMSKLPKDVKVAVYSHSTVPKLWEALEQKFNMQTMFTTAVNILQLFTMKGHVSAFNKTLDKLESIYVALQVHKKAPSNKTYISAINLATPPQYKWVGSMLEQSINQFNAANPTTKKVLMPAMLIEKLR
jgi:flagellar biosynthesis GTPase FlhF